MAQRRELRKPGERAQVRGGPRGVAAQLSNQAADTSEPTQYVQYLCDAAGGVGSKPTTKQTGANWEQMTPN